MIPSFTAALAAAVVAAWWLLSRRRPPLIRDADTSAIAALNRAQIALVQAGSTDPAVTAASRPAESGGADFPGPSGSGGLAYGGITSEWEQSGMLELPQRRSLQEVLRFQATLRSLYHRGGSSRLAAIQAARHWGDPSTLPMLRQALKDPNPAVVREAAAAIERFRGHRGPALKSPLQPAAAPRRVARTR